MVGYLSKAIKFSVLAVAISVGVNIYAQMSIADVKARNLANAHGEGKRAIVFGATQGSIGAGT